MRIIIIDTETIGKVNQDLLNVGYQIIDLNIQHGEYKTLCKRDYVVTELINNKIYCINDDFVGLAKYQKMINAIEKKQAVKRSLSQILTTLNNDLKKYNVLFGYAYNSKFDLDKFDKSNYQFPIPVYDIRGYAYDKIITTEAYKNWCLEHNELTTTERYIKGTVESVTRYLTNNPDFVENHTALDDSIHETNILVECVKLGSDITRKPKEPKNVPSGKVFHKTIRYNGEKIELEYQTTFEKNNITFYK